MARVTLNIEAENAYDLQSAINDLARGVPLGQQYVPPPQPEDADKEVPGPTQQPESQPVHFDRDTTQPDANPDEQEQPKKRKRRTKAEIEADKKAWEAKQAEKQAGVVDSKHDENPEPGATIETVTVSRQDVDTVMRMLVNANGGEQMVGILRELGAVNDAGEPKISALDEAKYAEAIQKAHAAFAELKAQADQVGSVLG